jgi:hypothetical protein
VRPIAPLAAQAAIDSSTAPWWHGRPVTGLRSGIREIRFTDSELDRWLTTPGIEDELGEPTIIIVTPDGSAVGPRALDRLTALPCVVIADGHDPDAPPDHADLVVESEVCGAAELAAGVSVAPVAAISLLLLLRAGPYRSPAAAIVAESAAYSALQAGPEFVRWRGAHPARDRRVGEGPPVRLERTGSRLEIVLDRPHVRNAVNRGMRDDLLAGFRLVAADSSIVEVVVRGDGPTFCSGGDLDEFGSRSDPASAHLVRVATSIGLAVAAVAERVTFHVHGACAGAGIELPAFAGTVVAHPDATFALPETRLGLMPGAGGTVSLVLRAGRHRVAMLALCGRSIDARRALQWGLVDRVTGVEGS